VLTRIPSDSLSSESPSPEPSPEMRALGAFTQIADAAGVLNSVSDQLQQPVAIVEAALKRLNVGIETWIAFSRADDEDHDHVWLDEIGYGKLGGKWGVAIRQGHGDSCGDWEYTGQWLFAEAPRALRLASIDKLPELLERLAAEAKKTADELNEKLAAATQIAKAIERLAADAPRK
jgi:hypothetical protein